MIGTMGGVTLLAAAGSAFNQLQERDLDLLMARTRHRPLPNGDLTPYAAAMVGALCLLSGLLMIYASGGLLPGLLALMALVWYLGLYTPLKRRTSFALAAGGVCGAIPPVIGWCSAGGTPTDFRIMMLAGLLYLWQIPHFWLFQRRHATDYRRAGIPLFESWPGVAGPGALCRLWMAALGIGSLLLPAFGVVAQPVAPWCAVIPLGLGILSLSRSESTLFNGINLFPLLVTLISAAQKLTPLFSPAFR